jgi:hypothetical protein
MSINAADLPPMPVGYMRDLKAKTDKENDIRRSIKINNIVIAIYRAAVEYAATHEERSYEWNINKGDKSFIIFNISAIVERLEPLFPGCLVEDRMLAVTMDGNTHEISNMGSDELSEMHIISQREVIVIDWS